MDEPFRLGELVMVDDVEPARWVVDGVRNFAYDVGSLVPVGFEAYARLFHPATRWVDAPAGEGVEVRWSEVAAAHRRRAHPLMQWSSLTGLRDHHQPASKPGVWDDPPRDGSLGREQASALAGVLARFTRTPETCWFAAWEGSGARAWPVREASTLVMPNRPMGLFTGPLAAVTTSFDLHGVEQLASLWWPDDRAWCVATDTDLNSTYLGGSAACIHALLDDDRLEIAEVSVDDKITWDSDVLNPLP
jgi:hypothetical protein